MSHPHLRAVVIHESMFGNTERVARAVAAGLRLGGLQVETVDIAHAHETDLAQVQLLVVGAPTHAFALSRPSTRRDAVRKGARPDAEAIGVREWLESGPTLPAYAAAFDTRMTWGQHLPSTAARRASRMLARRGCRLLTTPAGFHVEDTSGPLSPGELERAVAWGRELASSLRNVTAPALT